jgi:hypothetical protein
MPNHNLLQNAAELAFAAIVFAAAYTTLQFVISGIQSVFLHRDDVNADTIPTIEDLKFENRLTDILDERLTVNLATVLGKLSVVHHAVQNVERVAQEDALRIAEDIDGSAAWQVAAVRGLLKEFTTDLGEKLEARFSSIDGAVQNFARVSDENIRKIAGVVALVHKAVQNVERVSEENTGRFASIHDGIVSVHDALAGIDRERLPAILEALEGIERAGEGNTKRLAAILDERLPAILDAVQNVESAGEENINQLAATHNASLAAIHAAIQNLERADGKNIDLLAKLLRNALEGQKEKICQMWKNAAIDKENIEERFTKIDDAVQNVQRAGEENNARLAAIHDERLPAIHEAVENLDRAGEKNIHRLADRFCNALNRQREKMRQTFLELVVARYGLKEQDDSDSGGPGGRSRGSSIRSSRDSWSDDKGDSSSDSGGNVDGGRKEREPKGKETKEEGEERKDRRGQDKQEEKDRPKGKDRQKESDRHRESDRTPKEQERREARKEKDRQREMFRKEREKETQAEEELHRQEQFEQKVDKRLEDIRIQELQEHPERNIPDTRIPFMWEQGRKRKAQQKINEREARILFNEKLLMENPKYRLKKLERELAINNYANEVGEDEAIQQQQQLHPLQTRYQQQQEQSDGLTPFEPHPRPKNPNPYSVRPPPNYTRPNGNQPEFEYHIPIMVCAFADPGNTTVTQDLRHYDGRHPETLTRNLSARAIRHAGGHLRRQLGLVRPPPAQGYELGSAGPSRRNRRWDEERKMDEEEEDFSWKG